MSKKLSKKSKTPKEGFLVNLKKIDAGNVPDNFSMIVKVKHGKTTTSSNSVKNKKGVTFNQPLFIPYDSKADKIHLETWIIRKKFLRKKSEFSGKSVFNIPTFQNDFHDGKILSFENLKLERIDSGASITFSIKNCGIKFPKSQNPNANKSDLSIVTNVDSLENISTKEINSKDFSKTKSGAIEGEPSKVVQKKNTQNDLPDPKNDIQKVDDGVNAKDDKSGSKKKDYKVLTKLGSGGFGDVFLIQNKENNLKALKRVYCKDAEQVTKAMKEVFVLKGFSHKNVIQYDDIFFETTTNERCKFNLCFTMPYYKDGDLAHFITKRYETQVPFSEKRVVSYFTLLAEGLKYIHDKNIIHRDIKPENIFMAEKFNNLILADFGLLTKLSASGVNTTLEKAGTPKYCAPEIFTSNKAPSKACDIFSLGCVFYYMMTLEYDKPFYIEMFKNKKFFQQIKQKMIKNYHYLIADIVVDMLQPEPSKRVCVFDLLTRLKKINPRQETTMKFVEKKIKLSKEQKSIQEYKIKDITVPLDEDTRAGECDMKLNPLPVPVIHKSTGDSQVELHLDTDPLNSGRATVNVFQQGWPGKSFKLYVYVHDVVISNPYSNEITVEFEGDYQTSNGGEWEPIDSCHVYESKYNFDLSVESRPNKSASNSFVLGENEIKKISLCYMIEVEGMVGKNNYERRRVPAFLPSPFKVKIIMTDIKDKTREMIVEKVNQQIYRKTKEDYVKSNANNCMKFVKFDYIDDFVGVDRMYYGAYVKNDNSFVVTFNSGRTGVTKSLHVDRNYISTSTIKQGKKEEKSEIELKNMEIIKKDEKNNESSINVYALYSKDHGYQVYGYKIILRTSRGEVTSYVHIPIKAVMQRTEKEIDKNRTNNLNMNELEKIEMSYEYKNIQLDVKKHRKSVEGKVAYEPKEGPKKCKQYKPDPDGNSQIGIDMKYDRKKKKVLTKVLHNRYMFDEVYMKYYIEIYNVKFKNSTNEKISGTVKVEMKSSGGEYVPCGRCLVGPMSVNRFGHYSWAAEKDHSMTNVIRVEENKIISNMGIRVEMPKVKEERETEFARQKLPRCLNVNPLVLKVSVNDIKGKSKSQCVELIRKPYELPITEDIKKKVGLGNIKEELKYIFVDNVEKERRFYYYIYIDKDDRLCVKRDIRVSILTRDFLDHSMCKARQYKLTEMLWNECCYDNKFTGFNAKVLLLFDEGNNYQPFALKLYLKSATGVVIDYLQIPFDLCKYPVYKKEK